MRALCLLWIVSGVILRNTDYPKVSILISILPIKSTKKQTIEEQLKNEMPMSQFERAMKELEVVVIHANS